MKHYSKEFKEEALKLSDEIGVKKPRSSSVLRTTRWRTGVAYAETRRPRRR